MASKKSREQARAERAAELLAQQQRAERSRQLKVILGVVAMVLVVIAAGFGINKWVGSKDAAPDRLEGTSAQLGLAVGKDDAATEIVIFEDFLCPFCGALEQEINDDLDEAVASGDVIVDYRPINLLARVSDYSLRSANAFQVVREAAGDDVAKEYHDLLYANQPEESGPYPSDDDLIAWAVEAGAEKAQVAEGIKSLSEQQWVEDATTEALDDVGIEGTPTIYIDGELVEGTDLNDIADQIKDAL